MSGYNLKRLSKDIEESAFDMVLEGKKLEDIAKELGFSSRHALQRYLIKYPEFMQMFQQARLAECDHLEEQVRHVLDEYSVDAAKIQLEVLTRILKWRDPKRYGERQQIDLNMSIDISGSLERAEKRMIDVSPSNVLAMINPRKPSDESSND